MNPHLRRNEKFCLENAFRVMFTDICCHLTDMTFFGACTEITTFYRILEGDRNTIRKISEDDLVVACCGLIEWR